MVAAGFLACIAVELAFGKGGWPLRLALGLSLALVDFLLFFLFVGLVIKVGIATGPSRPDQGAGPVLLLAMLLPWVLPGARLWWLRRDAPR